MSDFAPKSNVKNRICYALLTNTLNTHTNTKNTHKIEFSHSNINIKKLFALSLLLVKKL